MATINLGGAEAHSKKASEMRADRDLHNEDLLAGWAVSMILISIIGLGMLLILATVFYCIS
jgi:hypothetical protein